MRRDVIGHFALSYRPLDAQSDHATFPWLHPTLPTYKHQDRADRRGMAARAEACVNACRHHRCNYPIAMAGIADDTVTRVVLEQLALYACRSSQVDTAG